LSTRFDRRVAIITGAGSGIGEATARGFAAEGGRVVLMGRTRESLDRVVADIEADGGEAVAVVGDVTSVGDVQAVVATALDRFGAIDVLVNNAGMSPRPPKSVLHVTDDDFWRVMATNVWGPFICTRAVAPTMVERGYGRIVNVGSRAHHGEPRLSIYSASKSALHGFTNSVAMELGLHGVTVNVVAPGATPTALMRTHEDFEARVERMRPTIAVGRLGRPEDTAAAILFFASEEAGFVTSELLHTSGGRYYSTNAMGIEGTPP
jgi:3-oxoacyl-[acyl-carrier protein] reductase